MTVPFMDVNGVSVSLCDTYARRKVWSGKTFFELVIHVPEELKRERVHLPGIRMLQRLSRKYLGGTFTEPFRRSTYNGYRISMLIPAGTTQEQRAVFLAALCTKMKVPQERLL